jgi:hypothetical protein
VRREAEAKEQELGGANGISPSAEARLSNRTCNHPWNTDAHDTRLIPGHRPLRIAKKHLVFVDD